MCISVSQFVSVMFEATRDNPVREIRLLVKETTILQNTVA